jgi:hypothetical protein
MTSMTSPWYMAKAQVFLLACGWREARIAQGAAAVGARQTGAVAPARHLKPTNGIGDA